MSLLTDVGHDLRHGLRSLRRSPTLSATVVLSLALGIGANTAIFSLLNSVVLRPLPVPEPARLVLFSDPGEPCARRLGTPTGPPGRRLVYSYPLYQRLKADLSELEGLAAQEACSTTSAVRAGANAEAGPERAEGRAVSAGFFSVMGVSAALGRTFSPEDETAPGANPVVVLSHGYWLAHLGGDPGVIGRPLTINGTRYTVIGVTAAGFSGAETGSRTDFWVPLTMQEALTQLGLPLHNPQYSSLLLIGRLRPGAAMSAVQARADAVYHQWLAQDAELAGYEAREPTHVRLDPGATGIAPLRGTFLDPLLALMAGVGLLLLIVWLNVSHLLLSRFLQRQRELSIRSALGASRGRIVRQLAVEGVLLVAVGAALGALASSWFSQGLLAIARTGQWERPLALDVSADGRVFAWVAALALATATLVALLPGWQAARGDLQSALRAASPTVAGRQPRQLTSRIAVVSQVALSLVLLVGAGLLAVSLSRLRNQPTGFDVEPVLLANVNIRSVAADQARARQLYDQLQARLAALPGVQSVSLSLDRPLSGGFGTWHLTSGTPPRRSQIAPEIVTPDYFRTLGIPLVSGRAFTRFDREGTPRVAVINQKLADRAFGGAARAIGQRFQMDADPGPPVEIVGVVGDARLIDLRSAPRSTVFMPAAQPPGLPVQLHLQSLQVRAAVDPASLADQVRATVRQVHPGLPLLDVQTLRVQRDSSLVRERLLAILSTTFGLVALFLISLGIYGVLAQWTARRRQEIGVRMALGATAAGVRWLVLRQAFALVLLGLLIGVPAALAAARVLRGVLYGVRPLSPVALLLGALILFLVAALAAYLPARRASRADPMLALRSE